MITYDQEIFSSHAGRFDSLWDAHGIEVRGKPLCLNLIAYFRIENEGRLVWIVARDEGSPVAYSCHWWYKSLHFDERVGHDDLWFVSPDYRGRGIGRKVKEMGHAALKNAGVVTTEDLIRSSCEHPRLMADLGFKVRGIWWMKEL